MSGIDTKIEPLVKFLNQLDGVITIKTVMDKVFNKNSKENKEKEKKNGK